MAAGKIQKADDRLRMKTAKSEAAAAVALLKAEAQDQDQTPGIPERIEADRR